MKNVVLAYAAALLLISTSASADIYECNGVYKSTPCGKNSRSTNILSPVRESKSTPLVAKSTSLKSKDSTKILPDERELREVKNEREIPEVQSKVLASSPGKIKLTGHVKGQGQVILGLYFNTSDNGGKVHNRIKGRELTLNLPAKGGQTQFTLETSIPPAETYSWELEIKNAGKFGILNLEGCCPAPIKGECRRNGEVRCNANLSEVCKCQPK